MEIHWRSFELRPKGAPPISPEYRVRVEAGQPRLRQMARDIYGVKLNQGPFGINGRPALVGAKYAEAHGAGPAYHARIMRAYWEEAQDIGDLSVLRALASEVGLDAADFAAALDDPAWERQVDADIEIAARYGLSGVPAIVFADKYLVSGAQPPETLRQMADKVRDLEAAAVE